MAKIFRLENRAAHLKTISLGAGGELVSIPPTEDGKGGVTIKLETEAEQTAFARALETPAVKAWIDEKELVVIESPEGGEAALQQAQAQRQPTQPQPQPNQSNAPDPNRPATEPARTARKERDKE